MNLRICPFFCAMRNGFPVTPVKRKIICKQIRHLRKLKKINKIQFKLNIINNNYKSHNNINLPSVKNPQWTVRFCGENQKNTLSEENDCEIVWIDKIVCGK